MSIVRGQNPVDCDNMNKRFEALPSAGIFTKYRLRPRKRSQSLREQGKILECFFRDANSFNTDDRLEQFISTLTRFANRVLSEFTNRHGLPRPHYIVKRNLRGYPELKRQHRISRRIEEIRSETRESAPRKDVVLNDRLSGAQFSNFDLGIDIARRRRRADAERAADALELLENARMIPAYVKNIHPSDYTAFDIWHLILATFEMGQAYVRMQIRPIEALAGPAIRRSSESRARIRQQMEPVHEARRRAYEDARTEDPGAKHWTLCGRLAGSFGITPKAFSNSIPPTRRVKPRT